MRTKNSSTVEPQYDVCLEVQRKRGFARFGLMSNFVWDDDPRRLTFLLSRYKFVSKMFSGRENVLEVGCADAFGSRLVRQEVKKLTVVDFDPLFISDAQETMNPRWNYDFKVHDMLSGPVPGKFDAAYSLDVLEHITSAEEDRFLTNICASLDKNGSLMIGTPSLQSQAYASPASKAGHVNCKDAQDLKQLMRKYFENVFIFSMNDEVIHTGYSAMAHYLFALCCTKKQ